MSGVERGQGVLVWRIPAGTWSFDYTDEDPEGGVSFLRNEPGCWFPTDEASLAQMRETISEALRQVSEGRLTRYETVPYADAVMRLLFGQDAT